jgi:hypothetical protein
MYGGGWSPWRTFDPQPPVTGRYGFPVRAYEPRHARPGRVIRATAGAARIIRLFIWGWDGAL